MNVERLEGLEQVWNLLKFEVLDDGFAHLDSRWNQTHVHPPYARLYYIADGMGRVDWAGTSTELIPGRAYLIPTGITLSYSCPEAMSQLYFHIVARTRDGYDLFARCKRVLELSPVERIDSMVARHRAGTLLDTALLKSSVEADLWRFICAGGLEEALTARHSPFLERVFEAVRGNLTSSLTVGDVARLLAMSESTLTKRFRREFGIALGQYIDELLFQEICRLLTATELSVGEIAERLGFCDQFYLTRFFGNRQNMPPSRYRALLRGQV